MTERNEKGLDLLKWCRENVCTPDGKRICLICGHKPEAGESTAVCVFIPDEKYQKRIGAPLNKERVVIYLLCEECLALPNRNERVEEKIFRAASVQ
jgi:hypothetical protein